MKKFFSILSVTALLFGSIGFNPVTIVAAQFSGVKDTMTTLAPSTTATHVITATLVGGDTFAAGETLTYDFVDADFTLNAIGNWQTSDFSFNDGTARTVTAVSSSSGVDPSCSAGSNNVAVTINTSTNNFKVTACSSYSASSGNATVTFTINGTTSAGTGTMTNKSSDVDSSVFSITESNGDTASGAVAVETNDVVNITATVAPTLTFSNDDASIGFGTLTAGAARYATGDTNGTTTANTTAHTLTLGTNATSGYTLTYNGATLTSGSNTIPAATITGDADGTPGSSQFALDATVTGTGTVTSGYSRSANDYNFVAGSATQVASATGAVSSDTVAVRYLANISASQAAGSYVTNLTYVATGNF